MTSPDEQLANRRAHERSQWKGQRPGKLFDVLESEPLIGNGFCGLGDALLAAMPARTRELVALRVSAELECSYAWNGHCHIALDAALSHAEIASVAAGPAAFAGHDGAVLQAVDELLSSGRLSGATRSILGGDALSVTIATGTYRIVAWIMQDIAPEPGVAPIPGVETPARARESYAALTCAASDDADRLERPDMRSNTATSMQPTRTHPDGELTLAQAQIELAVRLSDVCARPARWHGPRDADAHATCAFFLISAASVNWVEAAAAHPRIGAVDVSIEAMGVFAAIEASIATGRLQIVICGSGPGTLGPLWAVPAATAQGATVLVLAPRTPPQLVGANDIQESSYHHPLHTAGAALYDEVIAMEHVAEMPRIAVTLRHLFSRPQGAVVQLSVPTSRLGSACPPLPDVSAVDIALPAPSASTIARVVELLTGPGGPPAFLLGSGSVAYRDSLGALVEHWRAVHFTTPAATAILPGSLGVVGNAAYGDVPRRLRELDVRCLVVLGSRLGTASGGGDDALLPEGCRVVHVDVDPDVIAGNAVATWNRPVLSVTSDIGEFLDALQRIVPWPGIPATSSAREGVT